MKQDLPGTIFGPFCLTQCWPYSMKFELKSYNFGLSDNELLSDLRDVAETLGKKFVTKAEYDKHGRLCSSTFQKRFGSWGKAIDLAGLKRSRYDQITTNDYIDDLKRVAEHLESNSLTSEDYKKHGKFSYDSVVRHLGSWKKALQKSALQPSMNFNPPISNDDLFENLEQLWEKLERQPSKKDFIKSLSRYSYDTYPRRFGTYRKALESFVASFDENDDRQSKKAENEVSSPPMTTSSIIHKRSRNISWRLRFLVMRRDNFKCCFCGKSPVNHQGTVLEIDHIKAWAEGGETELENLQTLCKKCNGGKSNLPIKY